MTKKRERYKIVSDQEILEIIKKNPRITVKELTVKLGYSHCTTHQRVNNLVDKGLIKKEVIMATYLEGIE